MIELDETVTVDRPRGAVYELVAHIDRLPLWLPAVRDAALIGSPPLAVGSAIRLTIDGPGGPVEALGEVTELRAPERLAFRTTKAPVELEAGVDLLERGPTTTDLRLRARIVLPGMLRFAEGMVRKRLAQERPALVAELRRRVEDGIPTG